MNDYPFPRVADSFSSEIIDYELRKAALGDYIKAIRSESFPSQTAVARELNTDRSKFVNYEKGKSFAPIGYLAYLLQRCVNESTIQQTDLAEIHFEVVREINTVIELVYNHGSREKHLHITKFRNWQQLSDEAERWRLSLEDKRSADEIASAREDQLALPTGDTDDEAQGLPAESDDGGQLIKSGLPPHLVARVDRFIGRDEEIETIYKELSVRKMIFLCGPTGMGKTALATIAIRRIEEEDPRRFPDGVYYYNFNDDVKTYNIDTALKDIAQTFGVAVTERTPPRDAARHALRGKKLLLFFDGTEVCEDLTEGCA